MVCTMGQSNTIFHTPTYPKREPDCKPHAPLWPVGQLTRGERALRQRLAKQGVTASTAPAVRRLIFSFADQHTRNLPWRHPEVTPYQVMVSEIMLQQTQVDRVLPKYCSFLSLFPTVHDLARATLPEVLSAWQGLGYNRRGRNLRDAAVMIVERWAGVIPDELALLKTLPGIGEYTASAVMAFAFNKPALVLETNIRAVILHLVYPDQSGITDQLMMHQLAILQPANEPRRWYNALMDYGSDLKRRFVNPSRAAKAHTVQSRFEGSDRQIRGELLRLALAQGVLEGTLLDAVYYGQRERVQRILHALVREGLLESAGSGYLIPKA